MEIFGVPLPAMLSQLLLGLVKAVTVRALGSWGSFQVSTPSSGIA
jgi:hypothetical protein